MDSCGAYKEWTDLFDKDVLEIWEKERKELQRAAMLLCALQKELKKVHSNVESEIHDLRLKLEQKDTLSKNSLISSPRLKLSPMADNKENILNVSEMESPDLFRNNINNSFDNTTSTSFNLLTSDDDITKLDSSPTLNKRKRHSKKPKSSGVKKNVFERKSDQDESVIACTPDFGVRPQKTDSKCMKKKSRNSTLTQIFLNRAMSIPDSDTTYIDEKEKSEMGITDLLNYINVEEKPATNKKPKMVEPEVVVKGHARKQLKGFSCEQCKNFYGNMKLSSEELQKKLDECSRHRYKYNPPSDTIDGFWDLTFPSQIREVKREDT